MKERKHLLLNLVAERRKQARLLEKKGRQLIWTSVILLAIIILYLLYGSVRIFTLQADLKELETRAETYAPILSQAQALKKEINSLIPRLNYIQDLRQNIYLWQGLSLEILRLLPPDAWLNSLSFSPSQGDVLQISISGNALSYKSVGEFILKLQGTGHYKEITLESAGLSKIEEREVVQFQIKIQLPLPKSEVTNTTKGEVR